MIDDKLLDTLSDKKKSRLQLVSEYRDRMGPVLWTNPDCHAAYRQRYFGKPPPHNNIEFMYYGIRYTHFQQIDIEEN